jgi:hypothetical protein
MEKVVTLSQRGDESGKAVVVHIACSGKSFHPLVETGGLIHGQRLVGPERRQHFRRMSVYSRFDLFQTGTMDAPSLVARTHAFSWA